MQITVNGEEHQLNSTRLLEAVLAEIGVSNLDGVAVAINEQVIPKSAWATTTLHEHDRLLIIRATAGG